MAERLARAINKKLPTRPIEASSAGTRAVVGSPIHPASASVVRQLGADPSNFASRQLTARIALGADLILTMTRTHRDAVLELAPRQLRRTFTLSEAALLATRDSVKSIDDMALLRGHLSQDDITDIADPIGRDPDFHYVTGAHIAELLEPVLEVCRRSS